MTWVARLRHARMRDRLERHAAGYAAVASADDRRAEQLALLNQEWSRIVQRVPFYRDSAAAGDLPGRFDSLEQFAAAVPPTTREDVQQTGEARASEGRPADFQRITGGSTGQPVQLPAWEDENRRVEEDLWWSRRAYGIYPDSRLFLIWGHSHLLGEGLRGWVNARKRELQDRLLGYCRFSAYDLQEEAMRRAGSRMIRFRPDYLLGYGVALHRFAEANRDRGASLRELGLRMVVGTSESYPHPETPELLGELFGCPVAMEYGAVESGLIAHTVPEGHYVVPWRSVLLEVPSNPTEGRGLRITTLYPRCFPLVRYEIGDEIELEEGGETLGITSFRRVIGRCNDYLVLPDGTQVHSEVFSHAVRPCSEVRGFQVVQQPRRLVMRVTGRDGLSDRGRAGILERLAKVHPDLGRMEFKAVDTLEQTVAGKTRMIVVETEQGSLGA
ncbi:hypothetical protein ABI59_04870 [Acidobacteria bacterium Mor1]|nr:hypothetical protein ABI59_04870 [Acidobacteria bacterium Mor1]